MDYKFRLSAFQHAAGSEDAKIKISIGDTVLVAEAAVSLFVAGVSGYHSHSLPDC